MGGYWGVTAVQFAALWRGTGQDRFPYPFQLVSEAETAAEHEAQQRNERDRFSGPEHDLLRAAILILAEPDLRIEIAGGQGPQRNPIRIIGAIQRGYGIAAVQHPDQDGRCGDIVIRGCEPYDIPRQLIAQLPDVDSGRARPVSIQRRSARQQSQIDTRETLARKDFETVLNRPESGQGVVLVHQGSRLESRRIGGVAWRDIIGDGRYLVFGDAAVTVQPGNSWDLLEAITSLVGNIGAGHAR